MRPHPPPYRLPDQNGRRWLITGATHGVGREVARAAQAAGAEIWFTARNPERGRELAQELSGSRVVPADLADLTSIRAAAELVDGPVDVLVNNAGMVAPSAGTTVDGFETTLGTNVLGPFALTNLIADRLRGRVVIVASGAHRRGVLDWSDPHFRHRRYSVGAAYAQSKLADLLWGLELERRLRARGVQVQLAHPGWALTNLQNATANRHVNAALTRVCSWFAQSAADGAQPVLYAATEDLPAGSYVGPDGRGELRGRPTLVGRSRAASDREAAQWLWEFAARETGTDLPPVSEQEA